MKMDGWNPYDSEKNAYCASCYWFGREVLARGYINKGTTCLYLCADCLEKSNRSDMQKYEIGNIKLKVRRIKDPYNRFVRLSDQADILICNVWRNRGEMGK